MPVTSREFLVGRDQPDDAPDDVHGEVKRRIAQHRAKRRGSPGSSNDTPYLLLLVRPDGIDTYCMLQAVLRDMTLDFGYEFIDADWVLDFSAEDGQPNTQPWMARSKTPTSPAPVASSGAARERPRPIGLTPYRDPIATSGNIAQGFRHGEGPGSGSWTGGGGGQTGMGGGGTGSGPFVPGSVLGGTGSLRTEGRELLRIRERSIIGRRRSARWCAGSRHGGGWKQGGTDCGSGSQPVRPDRRYGFLAHELRRRKWFKWFWFGTWRQRYCARPSGRLVSRRGRQLWRVGDVHSRRIFKRQ